MALDLRSFLETRIAVPLDFAPDGDKVLVASNLGRTMQVYRTTPAGGELVAVTSLDEPVGGAQYLTADEVLVATDTGGNERLQLSLVADDGKSGLRPLVHDPEYIHRPGGVTRNGGLLAFTTNRRNGVDFDVWLRDLTGGEQGRERMVFDAGGWCAAAGFSPDGRWLAVLRLTEVNGDNDLYLVDVTNEANDAVHVSAHEGDAAFGAPAWLPDSTACFFVTDCGRDVAGLARYDVAKRSWDYVVDLGCEASVHVDWRGRHLLVHTMRDGYSELELRDPESLQIRAVVPLPGKGVAGYGGFSRDGRRLAYSFSSALEPGDAWVYDTETGETSRVTDSPKGVDLSCMVEPELHRVASFDGEQIPVFLYRPTGGGAERDVPVVVYIHGGPEAQFTPAWNPVVQYFVAHGFAVAAPNVRGSTGYGKRYHHLDDVRNRLDSVRDLEALHLWLDSMPGVDASRAALMGGSYGGYMVLAGLAFQPELWAAGVDIVGISSLLTFLENTSVWRRAFREREYGTLSADRDFLIEASPITHVDRMRAPLFIIHGANDPRVPLSEAEQIHAVLTERGVRCELAVYADEGHGLAKLQNRLDAYPRAAAFLEEVLA